MSVPPTLLLSQKPGAPSWCRLGFGLGLGLGLLLGLGSGLGFGFGLGLALLVQVEVAAHGGSRLLDDVRSRLPCAGRDARLVEGVVQPL